MRPNHIDNGIGENSGRATDHESNDGSIRNNDSERSSLQGSLSQDNCNNDGMRSIVPRQGGSFHTSGRLSSSWRRHSLSFSRVVAPQVFDDDIESEDGSQAGDIGDRALHSNRHSEISSLRSSVDNAIFIENGVEQQDTTMLNTTSPTSPLPLQIISPLSTDAVLYSRDERQSRSMHTSSQPCKEYEKELPQSLEYISCLTYLAVFGIFGVLTRYLLQKLFGPTVADITSDQSTLYLDLPSNMVGSFLMGWLGVEFKGDICQLSDLLAIGLTTGYLGSLTTFSGWNQKMLDLSAKGQWVKAAVGFLLGMFLVAESIIIGVETAKGFRSLLKRIGTSGKSCSSSNWRIGSCKRHLAVLVVLVLMLGLLWGVSGALLRRQLDGGKTSAQLWLACIVAPPGVWVRWFLARLNGKGLGRAGLMKWIPFGTLIANVSAACVMAVLSTVKKAVKTKMCEIIATGIQFGLLGCLSTVSTFIAEFNAMRQSKHPWRAYAYTTITILPSFVLGTLLYSIPVWTKGYQ